MLKSNTINADFTPENLIHAVQWGDIAFIEMALEYGISADTTDKDSCSLLHWAAINNRIEVVKLLISKYANMNIIGGDNKEIPLQWAVRCRNCSSLLYLLISEGSNIHHKSIYGYDALFIAIQAMQVNATFVLLNSGADPNTVDVKGDIALHWLLRRVASVESTDIIRLLLRFNASVTMKSTAADNSGGNNALHIIAGSGIYFEPYRSQLIYCSAVNSLIRDLNNEFLTPYEVALKTKNNGLIIRFFYDAYMYTTLPYITPIIASASLLPLGFVILYQAGWVVGISSFLLFYILTELLNQPYIITGDSRGYCGMAWGIIISIVGSYFFFLTNSFNVMTNIAGSMISLLIMYTLYKTTTTPSLSSYGGETSESRNLLVMKIINSEMVLEDKPEPTAAAVTIYHHCPFVCNCVGRGNRRMFVWFLLTASIGTAFFVYASIRFVMHDTLCLDDTTVTYLLCFIRVQHNTLFVITILSAITSIWISCMLIGQVGMIAAETTTHEVLKYNNQGISMFGSSSSSGIKQGCRNLFYFFYTGSYYTAVSRRNVSGSRRGRGELLASTTTTVSNNNSSSNSSKRNSLFLSPSEKEIHKV